MLFTLLKIKINKIILFFLPKICRICGSEGLEICNSCFDYFTPSSKTQIDGVDVLSCFEYNSKISQLLKDVKYNGKSELCSTMASYLMKFYKKEILSSEFVIPISSSFISQIKRKYNIPNLMCLYLKAKLKIKIFDVLKKYHSKSQVGLKKFERTQNATSFFDLKNITNCIKGKNVILIDDVFTTGATIYFAIQKIKLLNPNKIIVLTFARRDL